MKEILIISLISLFLLSIYLLLRLINSEKKQKIIRIKFKEKVKEFEWINDYCLSLDNDDVLAQFIKRKLICHYESLLQLERELESNNLNSSQIQYERKKGNYGK